jgi:hypothetical protein
MGRPQNQEVSMSIATSFNTHAGVKNQRKSLSILHEMGIV